jgi:hypothetical protein
MRRLFLTAALCALGALLLAAPAQGAVTKAIWGPSSFAAGSAACPTSAGCSAFPTYRELGVDVFQFGLHFDEIAPTPPANPRDPADPAYKWPAGVDFIVNQAAANGVGLAALIQFSPPWANGGQNKYWAPDNRAFADFAYAASRRYPSIKRWIVWGEPMFGINFQPMPKGRRTGPRRYGELVDATYAGLKQASQANQVIAGSTVSVGRIPAAKFIKWMRLPSGRMPRMNLWSHNPFDTRFPRLRDKPLTKSFRGLNDIDTLYAELRAAYGTRGGKRKKGKVRKAGKTPKLWLSEFTFVSDHPATHFGNNFFVSAQEQARWLSAAYAMVSKLKYVKGLGWFTLLDEQPETSTSANWGLMRANGVRKPSFSAYATVP